MRPSDHKANAAALFLRGDTVRQAARKHEEGDSLALPALYVDGATVFVYAADGILCVSVDLDDLDTNDSPFDVYGGDCVPMRLCVGDTVVYRAGPDGEQYGPQDRPLWSRRKAWNRNCLSWKAICASSGKRSIPNTT